MRCGAAPQGLSAHSRGRQCVRACGGAAMPFEANTAAEARTDSGGRWLTLHYPVYNADVYVTFSEVDGADALIAVLDNRRERMSLNLNGAHASTIHVTSADGTFETALVEAPARHAVAICVHRWRAARGQRRSASGCSGIGALRFAAACGGCSAARPDTCFHQFVVR